MTINNSSIAIGATAMTPTGGSATTLKTKNDGDGFHNVFVDDGSTLLNQTQVTFTVKEPRVQASAPGGYTQARMTAKIKRPLALDNGNTTVNSIKLELSVDPESTGTEISNLLMEAAQLLSDSDYDEFWKDQSLA